MATEKYIEESPVPLFQELTWTKVTIVCFLFPPNQTRERTVGVTHHRCLEVDGQFESGWRLVRTFRVPLFLTSLMCKNSCLIRLYLGRVTQPQMRRAWVSWLLTSALKIRSFIWSGTLRLSKKGLSWMYAPIVLALAFWFCLHQYNVLSKTTLKYLIWWFPGNLFAVYP